MADRADITPKLLRQLLRYDAETGLLFWLPRPREMFVSDRAFGCFKKRYEGKEALGYLSHGYKTGAVFYVSMRAHRAAWAIVHGCWPKGEIDHINGVRDDNRLANLRDVNSSLNSRNCKTFVHNTSGQTGVDWLPQNRKWRARINAGRLYHLGHFDKFEDAVAARKAAEERLGFHENHGRK